MPKKFDEGGVIRDAQGRFVRWASSDEDQLKNANSKPASSGKKPASGAKKSQSKTASGARKAKPTVGTMSYLHQTMSGGTLKPNKNKTTFYR